jgi:methyltransferase
MGLSRVAFLVLLVAVGLLRASELAVSRRHQQLLCMRGARKPRDPGFKWMVALHGLVLVCAPLEVVLLSRPFVPILAAAAGLLFVLANGVRWWVIRTLGTHWNVAVMDSTGLGVVSRGPYRFVRHPNYAAVFVEVGTLPLIHSAWVTALVGSAAHLWVLSKRVALEEGVLLESAAYRRAMEHKPRFVPRSSFLGERRATN